MSCHIVAWSLFQNFTQKYDKLMEANEIFFSLAVTAPMRKSFLFYNSTGEDLPAGLPASKYSSDLLKACEDHSLREVPTSHPLTASTKPGSDWLPVVTPFSAKNGVTPFCGIVLKLDYSDENKSVTNRRSYSRSSDMLLRKQ